MAIPLAVTRPAYLAPDVLPFFKALADETRLTILRLLALTDLKSGEIVEQVGVPQNAVSYHLKQLRALGLLRDRRSSADARDVYYNLDLDRLQALYAATGAALQIPVLPLPIAVDEEKSVDGEPHPDLDRPLRVLFLCTHNSARSQLAEGIMRCLGGDAVEVYSAGSAPTAVHPIALTLLRRWDDDPARYTSKSLDLFVGQRFDYIITVCDRVRDGCPVFPDDPVRIHWSFPDPALVEDSDAQARAFHTVQRELCTRIRYLLTCKHPVTGRRLPVRSLVRAEIETTHGREDETGGATLCN